MSKKINNVEITESAEATDQEFDGLCKSAEREQQKQETRVNVRKNILAAVEKNKWFISLFRIVTSYIGSMGCHREDKELDRAARIINEALYSELNRAYETMFMWGNVDPKFTEDAKRMAFQNMLTEHHSIMHLVSDMLCSPGGYRTDDEKILREVIEEFREKEKK